MTLTNLEARAQYELHDERATPYALAVNQTYDAFREIAAEHGLTVPNGDRAENLVTEMFAMLWDHNNIYGAKLKKSA